MPLLLSIQPYINHNSAVGLHYSLDEVQWRQQRHYLCHSVILEVYVLWTNTELKYENLTIHLSSLFADRVFQPMYNSTHNSFQACPSLRRYTAQCSCSITPTWRRLLLQIERRYCHPMY